MVSLKNQLFLQFLRDLHEVSDTLNAKAYMWGGFVKDIIEGEFLREHHDLDGFILDMDVILKELIIEFQKKNYVVSYDEKFMILSVMIGDAHAAFNVLHVNRGVAEWKHIGEMGSVFFPFEWLDDQPRHFYDVEVFTAGIKYEYGFRTIAPYTNPKWSKRREKDIEALEYLKNELEKSDISVKQIENEIWSYNPFWIDYGYSAFKPPVLVVPGVRELHEAPV